MVCRATKFLNEARAAGKKMGNTPSGKQGDVGKLRSRHNLRWGRKVPVMVRV